MELTYFLGANSAQGFFSHYADLLPPPRRKLIRIIKGGPGCGKSTLMRKIAAQAKKQGLSTECILCSSDPDSLDGIVIPEAGYALVDGTAPHVVEPALCGNQELYLDLGRGYDAAAMSSCGAALREIQDAGKACYLPATACLQAAASLALPARAPHGALSESLAEQILQKEIPSRGEGGTLRTIFLSAFTPSGLLCRWDTVSNCSSRVYLLQGALAEVSQFLQYLSRKICAAGWDVLQCDSPLFPGIYLEHLLIPQRGLGFVWNNPQLPYPLVPDYLLGEGKTDAGVHTLQGQLIQTAIGHLQRAKEYHDLLERACAPFVDFSAAEHAFTLCSSELSSLAAQK